MAFELTQGFVPILATCTSFKKWVLRSSSMRRAHARAADRERCRISFHAPASTGVPVCPVCVPAPPVSFYRWLCVLPGWQMNVNVNGVRG